MPSPLGHAAVGLATHWLHRRSRSHLHQWKVLIGVIFLSNLPDVDVLAGLLVRGNGSAFHHGATHSLLFALVAAFMASNGWRLSPRVPRFGFINSFLLVLSHVVADTLSAYSRTSLFWPFSGYSNPGYMGWKEVTDSLLTRTFQNPEIILVLGFLIILYCKFGGLLAFQNESKPKSLSFNSNALQARPPSRGYFSRTL